jgi:hypothetical protein
VVVIFEGSKGCREVVNSLCVVRIIYAIKPIKTNPDSTPGGGWCCSAAPRPLPSTALVRGEAQRVGVVGKGSTSGNAGMLPLYCYCPCLAGGLREVQWGSRFTSKAHRV